MHEGPEWWVKITDFGISKQATAGFTALRIQTGTPAFSAPEAFGIFPPGNESKDSYTNVVRFLVSGCGYIPHTHRWNPFKNQRPLGQFVTGNFTFPLNVLIANKVSGQGCHFVKRLMETESEDRPELKECSRYPWLDHLVTAPDHQSYHISRRIHSQIYNIVSNANTLAGVQIFL